MKFVSSQWQGTQTPLNSSRFYYPYCSIIWRPGQMTLSFNVKATHRNVFIKGSATTKATIPRSENLSVMGLNQFIFTVMTGSRNRRKAVDYSVKCTKFSRYAFLPAWPITRLLRVRRARLRNIARVAREFLQYWYLSSHVVRTSKQNRAKQ